MVSGLRLLDSSSAINYYVKTRIRDTLLAIEIFRYKAELACPRCSSSNVDKKYRYMGEYLCRHCYYFWRTD